MRVFLAGVVDRAAADRLYAELEPMRRDYEGAPVSLIPPDNYHVTLRFFGELTAMEVARVAHLVDPIAVAAAAFEARAVSARPLPNARRPSVIALPIESCGRLEALAQSFRLALDGDFGPPDKPFKAHLSVIRCRRGARFVASTRDLAFPLVFDRVAMFESTAGNGAPRYTPLRSFPIGASIQATPS